MRIRLNKLITIVFILVIISFFINHNIYAETELPTNMTVYSQNSEYLVRGLMVGYNNNRYVSILDMQKIFENSEKSFRINISDGSITIILDKDIENLRNLYINDDSVDVDEIYSGLKSASDINRELTGWSDNSANDFNNKALAANPISLNLDEKKYYTIVTSVNGKSDCFIQICDLCLLMDINAEINNSSIIIDSYERMNALEPAVLEAYGYFQGINSVLVGDATTGKIIYGYDIEKAYPIASTTKLMTYLITANALKEGKINLNDQVYIGKEAEDISNTSDGLINMNEGATFPLEDLLKASLIISSNESDHAVSEYVGKSEEGAVALMNEMAAALNLKTAEFYNCNGLPVYTDNIAPAKKQNRMSSKDMFKMVSYILDNYPEIKNITSIKYTHIDSMDKDLKNTNPLLFNMPETSGLKTGTTNRSGACLVTSFEVNTNDGIHDLVVVLLGAEGSQDRGRVSELMAKYGISVLKGEITTSIDDYINEDNRNLTANELVNRVVDKILLNH